MTDYNKFAKFYDEVMGDRSNSVSIIIDFINTHNPKAKSILELATGTGALLKPLSKKYQVSGLDLSQGMLSVAKKNVPKGKFYKKSMVDFVLPEKYDVIMCLFDSINHLMTFSDWKKLLSSSKKHLNKDGVLIFDVNTNKKFERVVKFTPMVMKLKKSTMIMDVLDIGKNKTNWNVKVFEHSKSNNYILHEENIQEIAFPRENILKAIKKIFKSVKVVDLDKSHSKKKGERLYFICKP